ncbi:Protein disulfide-isomerase A5, partial [Fragariocoptes setiger]
MESPTNYGSQKTANSEQHQQQQQQQQQQKEILTLHGRKSISSPVHSDAIELDATVGGDDDDEGEDMETFDNITSSAKTSLAFSMSAVVRQSSSSSPPLSPSPLPLPYPPTAPRAQQQRQQQLLVSLGTIDCRRSTQSPAQQQQTQAQTNSNHDQQRRVQQAASHKTSRHLQGEEDEEANEIDQDDNDDDVIEEMKDADELRKLIESEDYLLAFFYDKDDPKIAGKAEKILTSLETIDDDCDEFGISFVKIDSDELAREFGLHDELPALVYFEHQMPSIYEGPYDKAASVLDWIVHQKSEDTIEEVTEEILTKLIEKNPYVLVFYAPNSCTTDCEHILEGLETLDDNTDEHGILFVTTDDIELAKKRAKVTKFPALILFRQGEPLVYKGSLRDVDQVLDWVLSEETLDNPNVIETVPRKMFERMLQQSAHLLALFVKPEGVACKACDKSLATLEQIDHELEGKHDVDVVRVADASLAKQFGLAGSEPKLVYFKHRYPHVYSNNLVARDAADQIYKWVIAELENEQDVIELVSGDMLDILLNNIDYLTVLFYDSKTVNQAKVKKILIELERIDDDTDDIGLQILKCEDLQWAKRHKLGLDSTQLPALVYFERDKVPNIYPGKELDDEEAVLKWLIEQKTDDTIENLNKELLDNMIQTTDYVVAVFYKSQHKASDVALEALETIDDDLSEFDIHLVKINDEQVARTDYSIKQFPAIVLFRQTEPLVYEGDLSSASSIRSTLLEWLTEPENLESGHSIELVNERMFGKFLADTRYLSVLFYSSKRACKQCDKVLEAMEELDDEASAAGIRFVKVNSIELARKYNVKHLPALVLFANDDGDDDNDDHELFRYTGNMQDSAEILDWLLKSQQARQGTTASKSASSSNSNSKAAKKVTTGSSKKNDLEVELVSGAEIRNKIQGGADDHDHVAHVAVLVQSGNKCEQLCATAIETLSSIAAAAHKELDAVEFVRTNDKMIARELGLDTLPTLVYFEGHRTPNIYRGELYRREQVLNWLIEQAQQDTIEEVNRQILEQLIESNEYLCVLFYKQNCKSCVSTIEALERIDSELDLFGIQMVKIQDIALARRYGIKTFPALVYFRNGNPLIYEGDMKDEEDILEWLTGDSARDIDDEIEKVNGVMLDKLIDSSPFLAVLFYTDQEECKQCDEIIAELEKIDESVDLSGIDFVKTSDAQAARKWRVKRFPSLVYFRKQTPSYYDGDLLDEEAVLRWLTSADAFEIPDEIEEVNSRLLSRMLDTYDYIAVLFYEKNCDKCERVLHELERIDGLADDLDIMFVKIRDSNCAKKYGIAHFPTLVYFRKKFPSIYRGDLMREEKVLEWLRKNRYRSPDFNMFILRNLLCFLAAQLQRLLIQQQQQQHLVPSGVYIEIWTPEKIIAMAIAANESKKQKLVTKFCKRSARIAKFVQLMRMPRNTAIEDELENLLHNIYQSPFKKGSCFELRRIQTDYNA